MLMQNLFEQHNINSFKTAQTSGVVVMPNNFVARRRRLRKVRRQNSELQFNLHFLL